MVSDAATGRPNAIPGRLKAIVIGDHVSVAYAGHANQAIDTIRIARVRLAETGNLDFALETLRQATSSPDYEVDFLVAAHRPEACLHKIRAGTVSGNLNEAAIGDGSLVREILDRELQQQVMVIECGNENVGQPELRFWRAFHELFREHGIRVREAVGGFAINLLASPYGHTYQGHAAAMSWDTIRIPGGITPEQHDARRSGQTSWSYTIMTSPLRGVAILGVMLPQLPVGFIYSPLDCDEAIRVDLPPIESADKGASEGRALEMLRAVVDRYADRIGGGFLEKLIGAP
jgi:hypothetical protein